MNNNKEIFIKNIYYMLSYAYRVLRQSNYEEVEIENFENIHDLFAAILGKAVMQQLKQGLYREYVNTSENLSSMRGKLDMRGTIHNKIQRKQLFYCEFDELSVNNTFNQILKTTMMILVRQNSVKTERRAILKKALLFFGDVDLIDPASICWDRLRIQRNNQSYRLLLNVCNLVLDGLLLSTEKGTVKLASFLDDQRISKLYEKFILEYYRTHHPELHANADQISWNLDDGVIDFLPVMQTDVTLRYQKKILVIDAKFYAHTMQTRFDTQTLHSNHLYQIYTYVKNMDKDNTGNVSGVLLYARTEEQIQPNNHFSMGGNHISVQTLNLNMPFSGIVEQLEKIVNDNFGKTV